MTDKLVAPIKELIANPKNDITIPMYSRVLRPRDETLLHRGGSKGIALYREVLKDGRAYTVLQKRKRKLATRDWLIEPASTSRLDKKAADLVRDHLGALNMESICLNMLDATLMGFAVGEVVWEHIDNAWVATDLVKHDQARFVFDAERNPKLLTWDNLAFGIDLPARKFMVHRFEDLSSDPYGWGLGRVLFWHVLFKREGVAYWMKALERFATPMPVAKYPIGTLEVDQNRLMDAIAGALSEGALVVPIGTEVTFATATVSGTLTHADWCKYWDDQTAETVLGQNLSTNVGGSGSRAASETHKAIEDEMIDGDGNMLAATLRSNLFQWIIDYNLPGAQAPKLKFERSANLQAEEEAATARGVRRQQDLVNISSLRKMGYAPQEEQAVLAEVMGTELIVVAVPDPTPDLPAIDPAKPAAQFASISEGDLASDIDILTDVSQTQLDKWGDVIRACIADLLARGGELRELPGELLKLYPKLSTKKISALLGAALTNSELRGRADITDMGK